MDNLRHRFGVEQRTVAQSQFIPVIQSDHDLLLRDRKGTGKSFGIAVALASKLAKANDQNSLQRLCVVPNFELATQIGHWMRLLSGGYIQANTSIPAHTLVSAPAPLIESIDTLPFDHLDCIVLEEVDQALRLPARYAPLKKKQKRASNPKPTQPLVGHVLQRGAVRRVVSFCHGGAAEHEGDSKTALIESVAALNDIEGVQNGVLFVNTSVSASDAARQLAEYGLRARDILDYERDSVDKSTKLWIATEFSARGMGISDIDYMIEERSNIGSIQYIFQSE
ncbi:hypothetical protein BJV82DRAFT_702602 [Fennellomyces sp. T-0311]|nr:hypothetical protein BJV82DRAFT_702602 [Fennellomyces sp. T-0311]